MKLRTAFVLVAVMLFAPALALAQTEMAGPAAPAFVTEEAPPQGTLAKNPTTLTFTASADHSTTFSDGTGVLTRYELRLYLASAPTAVRGTLDLGKPTPSATNQITVDIATLMQNQQANTEFIARVVAIGPQGEGASDPSNPFVPKLAPAAKPGGVVIK